ncbi:hypothetical protein [Pseudobacillus wudalianchiensis]|uniref:hypothetical protein n=1 Tax=Pseudobacillus wudalianchiensis TaxID=1743143 RepID=UPI00159F1C1A|nr:hypothetical protein [Bacillus wudalianchiensis]
MRADEIIKNHLKYKDKSMEELIEERYKKHLKGQNELRKKYLPEKHNPNLDK